MKEMDIKSGYVYHIKDSYFDKVKDDNLMKNYEGGAYRPTYFCIKDEKTGLLWVIPMSSRTDKYSIYVQKDIEKFGKCIKIIIGEYADKNAAFLLQNMFPIIPKYIDHIHTIKQNPVPVKQNLQRIIHQYFREVLRLHHKGAKVVFPDINRLVNIMFDEMSHLDIS